MGKAVDLLGIGDAAKLAEHWSRQQAREALACGERTVRVLVEKGYVQVRPLPGVGAMAAPAVEWVRGYLTYLEDAEAGAFPGHSKQDLQLTRSLTMSASMLAGLEIAYEMKPRCYVCGRRLGDGDRWRWFVPASFQGPPLENQEPAFGCAHGHEGAVIEVRGKVFRIAPPGKAPLFLGTRKLFDMVAGG